MTVTARTATERENARIDKRLATLEAELEFRIEIMQKLRELAPLAIATLKRHLECGIPGIEAEAAAALLSIGDTATTVRGMVQKSQGVGLGPQETLESLETLLPDLTRNTTGSTPKKSKPKTKPHKPRA